jgi:exopolysaccharide production protein ExoZ
MADTTRARLDGIEICRGIAATTVVFYHSARHLDHNYGVPLLMGGFQFGHAGVDLFFVISGFIIMYVHYNDIGNPARLGHYLRQRITRVMPTYWVALMLTVALGVVGSRGFPSLADLIWSATLVPSNRGLLLDIAWTLRYEITFYALFCGLILNRGVGTAVLALWLAGIVLAAVGAVDLGWLPGSLYGVFNLQFFFGMSVAYAMRNAVIPAPRLILATGVALFALVALAEDIKLIDGYADPARIAYGLPAAVIVLGAAAAGRRPATTSAPLLRTLGAASYSIYLFQFIFMGLIWHAWLATGLDRVMPHIASFPLLAVGSVAGGILVSRRIEQPLIRLARAIRFRPSQSVRDGGISGS